MPAYLAEKEVRPRPDSLSGDRAHGEAQVYKGLLALGIKPLGNHEDCRGNIKDCQACPYKPQCTTSAKAGCTIKRHVDAPVFAYVDRLLRRPEAC